MAHANLMIRINTIYDQHSQASEQTDIKGGKKNVTSKND